MRVLWLRKPSKRVKGQFQQAELHIPSKVKVELETVIPDAALLERVICTHNNRRGWGVRRRAAAHIPDGQKEDYVSHNRVSLLGATIVPYAITL